MLHATVVSVRLLYRVLLATSPASTYSYSSSYCSGLRTLLLVVTVSSTGRLKQAIALVVHVVCCSMLCHAVLAVLYYDHCVY